MDSLLLGVRRARDRELANDCKFTASLLTVDIGLSLQVPSSRYQNLRQNILPRQVPPVPYLRLELANIHRQRLNILNTSWKRTGLWILLLG